MSLYSVALGGILGAEANEEGAVYMHACIVAASSKR